MSKGHNNGNLKTFRIDILVNIMFIIGEVLADTSEFLVN